MQISLKRLTSTKLNILEEIYMRFINCFVNFASVSERARIALVSVYGANNTLLKAASCVHLITNCEVVNKSKKVNKQLWK